MASPTTIIPGAYGLTIEERVGSLYDLIDKAFNTRAKQLWTAMPGIVKSAFDVTKGTITVQIAINDIARQKNVITPILLAPLLDVPVMLYGAGIFTITVPVSVGDECLVVFADRCIDAWFQSGGQQNQVVPRVHSLSDGFAILGLRNQTRLLDDYSTTSLQIRSEDGETVIDVADGAVTVTANTFTVNAQTVSINASSGMTLNSQDTMTLMANGQIDIESAPLNTKLDQRLFRAHEHSGVQTGGGVSGPVA